MTSFNLVEQPWIPVVDRRWQIQEISLMALLETWQDWREIQAENPPTTYALYRFLLAILHRAYQGPTDLDHWEEIRQDNGKRAIAYLREYQECFDLLHPERPFMQDRAIANNESTPVYSFAEMQADNTSTVFSHEHQHSNYSISFSQAARLLIRLQGFDPTSLRGFYPQCKGNRSAASTTTINAANVLVYDVNLQKILLQNLMQYDPEGEIPSAVQGEDQPSWETSYGGPPAKTIPRGLIHYLTYPWRRLWLQCAAEKVTGIAITMGDSLPEAISASQWECAIAYREDKPVRLSLDKQLWRDAHVFLQSAEKSHRPRIVEWFARLAYEEFVQERVTLRVYGLSADKAKPLGWGVEQLSAPKAYLTEKRLWESLVASIAWAEDHRQIFKAFRGSPYYVLAEKLNPETTGGDAISSQASQLADALDGEARYWLTLDREFPFLLDNLINDAETDADGVTRYGLKEIPKWKERVQQTARDAFMESIASIKDFRARSLALQALHRKLAELRASPEERQAKKQSKSKTKKEKKAS
ncbi:MAG: type I-E CRISPR-associated protein Cse1/CasA [Oscillatoriales cyanobacterium SM2_1_8]|nr:type I-E CRISPR-associated protein Cse1/CasA [Oscillatoriales cyanobacterium SM2_1_8]